MQTADVLVGSYARLGGGGMYPLRYRNGDWTVDAPIGGLYYVDLGSDRIRMLPVAGTDFGGSQTVYQAPPGCGPRHVAWHPHLQVACLVSERAATLTVLDRVAAGMWRARAVLPTLPPGVTAETSGGAIAIDAVGTRLYVTNRGHDRVVAYAIDADGDAVYLDHRPGGDASPRFLLLLEDIGRLIVTNEEGGSVVIFALDARGGFTSDPATLSIPGAVFALRTGEPA